MTKNLNIVIKQVAIIRYSISKFMNKIENLLKYIDTELVDLDEIVDYLGIYPASFCQNFLLHFLYSNDY